jgi:pyruvate kinase
MDTQPSVSEGSRRNAARELVREIGRLRDEVTSEGAAIFETWRPKIAREDFARSAENLARYLELRRRDLRALQRELMSLGLSSLGRAEGRVLEALEAVDVALKALAGQEVPETQALPQRAFFEGERILQRNVGALFGARDLGRGRILVTLDSEAANDPGFLLRLVQAGADAVRINCAHDDREAWRRMIDNVRGAERATNSKIPILMDIAGPKVRLAKIATSADRNRLQIGDEILLCRDIAPDEEPVVFRGVLSPVEILDDVAVGDPVSFDDGKVHGHIVRQTGCGLVARIERGRLKGMKIKPQKGVNFPGVALNLEPLTEQDLADLDFVAQHADLIGYSFVETADHVARLQRELEARRSDWQRLGLVAKIETPRAVHNLPEIIVQAAGQQPLAVMIARGDLAVELGFARLAEMQEEILWLCEAAHVPAIWPTEVLDGLVSKGVPSRGEMTDAAMAGRAECVMLNKGPNVLAGIAMLDKLLRRMAAHQVKKTPTVRALHVGLKGRGKAPCQALALEPTAGDGHQRNETDDDRGIEVHDRIEKREHRYAGQQQDEQRSGKHHQPRCKEQRDANPLRVCRSSAQGIEIKDCGPNKSEHRDRREGDEQGVGFRTPVLVDATKRNHGSDEKRQKKIAAAGLNDQPEQGRLQRQKQCPERSHDDQTL